MKKVLFILAVLPIMLACSKEGSQSVISMINVELNLEKLSDDVKNYFDITYNYVDFKGEKQSKKITDPTKVVFSIENPDLVNENSAPVTFTVEVTHIEKKGVPQKSEGEKYNSTISYELIANGYYVDNTIENFKYCCCAKESLWTEAFNYNLFSTAVKNQETEKATYKMYLVKNQDGNLRLKIEAVK